MALADQLDWVAKYRLIDGYRQRHDLAWDDARLAALDLQYADLRPDKSLFDRLGVERLTTDEEVATGRVRTAGRHPGLLPGEVPAALVRRHRGRQLGLAGVRHRPRTPATGADDGTDARNGAHVGTLLADCKTSSELLDRLGT